MLFPDINVWLVLVFAAHVHHSPAKAWFDGLPVEVDCRFCRLTQQGFLRIATNPKAFGAEALTLVDAWQAYDQLLGDPRIGFAEEPAQLEAEWRQQTQSASFSPQVWSDAYLAAFAIAAGGTLVTFDKGFSRYQSLNKQILA